MGRVRSGPPTSHTIDFPAHIKTNTLFISFSNKKKNSTKRYLWSPRVALTVHANFITEKKLQKKKHKKIKDSFFLIV